MIVVHSICDFEAYIRRLIFRSRERLNGTNCLAICLMNSMAWAYSELQTWIYVYTSQYSRLFVGSVLFIQLWDLFYIVYVSYALSRNTGWWEIDIHGCYSLVKIAVAQIRACKNNRRIWRHNASTPVRMTSQINCGDVTMLSQKRPSLVTIAKSAIDYWYSGIMYSEHKIARKKWNNTFVTVFGVTRDATSSLVKIIGKSPHSWPENRYSR